MRCPYSDGWIPGWHNASPRPAPWLGSRIPRRAIWSGADWNIYLFLFSACIALNWTLLGFAADLFGVRPPSRPHARVRVDALPGPTPADVDPLVREFEEVERKVRERNRPADSSHHRAA